MSYGPIPKPAEERFWLYVMPEPNSGCWIWTASLDSKGYGQIGTSRINGKKILRRAHQISYEIHHGAVSEGLEINHKCLQRWCVNPDHLEAVSHKENMRYGNGPAASRARQTHCKNGHEFTEQNTYMTFEGWRKCKACRRKARL